MRALVWITQPNAGIVQPVQPGFTAVAVEHQQFPVDHVDFHISIPVQAGDGISNQVHTQQKQWTGSSFHHKSWNDFILWEGKVASVQEKEAKEWSKHPGTNTMTSETTLAN